MPRKRRAERRSGGLRPEKVERGRRVAAYLREGNRQPIPSQRATELIIADIAAVETRPGEVEKAAIQGTIHGGRVRPTARQVEVLQAIVDGIEVDELARREGFSVGGIRRVFERLYWNLGVSGPTARVRAVAILVGAGMIKPPPLPIHLWVDAWKPGLAAEAKFANRGTTKLSPRQQEILELVALGRTTDEIAEQLGVTYNTVQHHRKMICRKLDAAGTHNSAIVNAVHRAHLLGLL